MKKSITAKEMKRKFLETKEKIKIPFELDQDVNSFELKNIEILSLTRVFNYLSEMEEEASSDEESAQKKYLREINNKANLKKMSTEFYTKNTNSKSLENNLSYKLDTHYNEQGNQLHQPTSAGLKKEIKISSKALRKTLRKLISLDKIAKEEIETMIWEVDEDLDTRVSKYEFEKMYKRCINDTEELEPKRLFYLVQFLMYDKDSKKFITEEDTLELLYVRYGEKFNSNIEDIFQIIVKNIDGDKKAIKEKVDYEEFTQRMGNIALKKRAGVKDRRTNYCSYIVKEE